MIIKLDCFCNIDVDISRMYFGKNIENGYLVGVSHLGFIVIDNNIIKSTEHVEIDTEKTKFDIRMAIGTNIKFDIETIDGLVEGIELTSIHKLDLGIEGCVDVYEYDFDIIKSINYYDVKVSKSWLINSKIATTEQVNMVANIGDAISWEFSGKKYYAIVQDIIDEDYCVCVTYDDIGYTQDKIHNSQALNTYVYIGDSDKLDCAPSNVFLFNYKCNGIDTLGTLSDFIEYKNTSKDYLDAHIILPTYMIQNGD